MAVTTVEILNTIRDNADDLYIKRVPSATKDNIAEVGKAITSSTITANAFLSALINRIAETHIKSKAFKNPLARLKGTNVPMGANIQEIFINPATDIGFDNDGTTLLKTTKPDGKACYYGLNRQGKYPQTISSVELERAFISEQAFMSLYNGIVTSLASGDEIDEFTLCKKAVGKAIDNGAVLIVESDIEKPKELSKSISKMHSSFQFPNTAFCGYNLVNKKTLETNKEDECVTFCRPENQCLLIRSDVQTEINYEVLASMFHMDVATLEAITILVDTIPSEKYDVYAVLMDKETIQMRDVVYRTETMYNGSTLATNLWLHHWQFIYLSMFGNCCAFAKTKTATGGGGSTGTP